VYWPVSGLGSYVPSWPLYSPYVPPFTDTKSLLLTRASNQYVDLGNNIRIQPNQSISISAWIFPTSSSIGAILSNLDANYGMDFGIINSGGMQLRFEMYGTTGAVVGSTSGTTPIPAGQWTHVVATYDGSNTTAGIKIYVNGVAQTLTFGGSSISGGITYSQSTKIGRDFYNGAFDGYIDELSVWDHALSSAEVTALYNNGLPGDLAKLSGILHWYRMGDGADTSSTIYDQIGTVNGTVTNGAVIAGFAPYYVPTLVSSTQVKNNPNAATLVGSTAFIAYYQADNPTPGFDAPYLQAWDVSNRATPSLIGTLNIAGSPTPYPQAFAPNSNRYLYVGNYKSNQFLQVVDVLDPTNPVAGATVSYGSGGFGFLQSNSIAFSADGNYAYVSGSQNVAAVVNISDPTNPSLVTTFTQGTGTGGDAFTSVAVKGNYLYLGGDSPLARVLNVYDISTPSAPSFVTSITTQGGYYLTFGTDPNILCLTCFGTGKVQIIDISTPSAPVAVGSLSIATQPSWSSDYGNNLLLTTADTLPGGGPSFTLTSVWKPSAPFALWSTTLTASGNSLLGMSVNVYGKYAYVTALYDPGVGVGDFDGYLQIWQVAP
jgi:hypothetical protein